MLKAKTAAKNILASLTLSLIGLGTALAGGTWDSSGGATFTQKFKIIYNWVVGLAGVIFVVMFLVGGIQYLTSSGNEESSTKAKKLLLDAIIGIIIVTLAYVGGSWIISQIGGTSAIT